MRKLIAVIILFAISGCTFNFKVNVPPIVVSQNEIPQKVIRAELTKSRLIGEFSTSLTKAKSAKVHNVRLAARFINGRIISSGEMFSYNAVVGPRTAERGFLEAPSLSMGKYVTSIGGGICQLSSTLHGAVVKAKLKVIERYRHSATVSYCPIWAEATVSYGQKDFRFLNNTSSRIKLIANVDERKFLVVQIWQI